MEFSILVTVTSKEIHKPQSENAVKQWLIDDIIGFAKGVTPLISVTITDDHSEQAIAELTRALSDVIGEVNDYHQCRAH